MLHDAGWRATLRAELAKPGAQWDAEGRFPAEGIALLRRRGLMTAPPVEPDNLNALLTLLSDVGRGDLSLGRIYEGHVNALLLISRHGSAAQQRHYRRLVSEGAVLGVWNTDAPANPLRLAHGWLSGAKAFASGADGVSHALVTVDAPDGRIMLMVPVEHGSIDRSWWRPLGMKASGSHVIAFDAFPIDDDAIIGKPDDYLEEPWFSAGAVRFVAVHVGGMHALFEAATAQLTAAGRDGDPFQGHRIARMGLAVQTGYLWLSHVATAWAAAARNPDAGRGQDLIALANAARSVVEAAALDVLETAERAVGAAAFIAPNPIERISRDLRTYLRQPAPDRALSQAGRALADGSWRPNFPDVAHAGTSGIAVKDERPDGERFIRHLTTVPDRSHG